MIGSRWLPRIGVIWIRPLPYTGRSVARDGGMDIAMWKRMHAKVEGPVHAVQSWVPKLARAGYASKGVLYAVVGILAAMAATGYGGATTDSKGALHTIRAQPFGQVMLALVVVGLAGYAVWRLVQAILDPEGEGNGGKAIAKRVGWFAIGVMHLGLVVYAIGLLTGAFLVGGGGGTRGWTARLMSWPGGPWVVGALGLLIVGVSLYKVHRGWKANLDKRLDLTRLGARARRLAILVSRFGMGARGVIGTIIGVALVFAGMRSNPREAKGLGEALASIQSWTLGSVMLGIVSLGLVAYGVYELVEARYRRFHVRAH